MQSVFIHVTLSSIIEVARLSAQPNAMHLPGALHFSVELSQQGPNSF